MAGRLVHVEFPAKDDKRAKEFWSGLFGWKWNTAEMPGLAYHMTEIGGDPAGGLFAMEDVPPGLVVYFGTEDIDAELAKVRELGGQAEDKQPIPEVGWFARCHDTEGNAFSLFQAEGPGPGAAG